MIDLAYLHPGTVIANFKVVDGRPRFPCESGWHVGLFGKFWRGATILTPAWKKAHPDKAKPANDAAEYYVVAVP